MNTNFSQIIQGNFNQSSHDANAASAANSGGNGVVGGLIAINALNPATATAAAVNLSPVSQANVASNIDSIFDADTFVDIL